MYTTKNLRTVSLISLLAIVFAIGFTAGVMAQEGPPPIPEQAKKLQGFIGTWEGTGTMTMGDMKHKIKISHITEPTADGWGLLNTEINEMEGMPTYRCINIFGFDPGGGMTHLYSVSNYGDCHDHKGKWSGDKDLKLKYEGVWDGKPMTEDVNITFDSADQYSFTVTSTVGGEQTMFIQATMTKK